MTNTEKLMQNLKRRATFAKEHDEILYVKADDILTLLDIIDSTSRVPSVPVGLDPNTKKLVVDFCAALAEKLYNAEVKYGRQTDWMKDDWYATCRQSLWEHIAKGDPRDVAAYCAFMWYHGWVTTDYDRNVQNACRAAMLAAAPQEVINYEKSSAQPFAYYANSTHYNTYKAAIKDGNEEIIALYNRDIDIHNQEKLRELVDVVWNTATESTEVPSTKWADELITKVFGVYKNDN